MRVLTITNWYPPHHFGGYELSCFDVMRGFVARGHEVLVLCSDTVVEGAPPPASDHEARVRRQLRLYHRDGELWRPGVRQRLAVERHNQAALARALDQLRPDVVSAWHFGALSLGLLTTVAERGIPIVYAVCDDWLLYGEQLDVWAGLFTGSPLRRAAGRALRPLVGVPTVVGDLGPTGPVLFVSETIRRRAEASPWWFHPTTVVFSGIDRETFGPRAQPEDRPWRWRLVTTGRPDPRKGFETVIRALPLLPEEASLSHFGLGGDAERRRLTEVADRLGVGRRVRFGAVERAALPAVYADADVMVFPSEWDEPFGLVPVEAMACGTPVVATTQGGSREFLVPERNVLRFEPGDAAGLAAAVRRLHDDVRLRRDLVAGGLALADALDVRHLVDTMERWHQWTVTGRTAGAPPPADRPPLVPQPHDAAVPVPRAEATDPFAALAAGASTPTTVRVPLATDLRTLRIRAVRWWRGSHRPPPVPAGGAASVADALGRVPRGWRVSAVRAVPWEGGKLGRLAPAVRRFRFLRLLRRVAPAVDIDLEQVSGPAR